MKPDKTCLIPVVLFLCEDLVKDIKSVLMKCVILFVSELSLNFADPVGGIMSEMIKKRSRPKIMDKLLSMGLVGDRKELYKRRASKSRARSQRRGKVSDDSDDDGL